MNQIKVDWNALGAGLGAMLGEVIKETLAGNVAPAEASEPVDGLPLEPIDTENTPDIAFNPQSPEVVGFLPDRRMLDVLESAALGTADPQIALALIERIGLASNHHTALLIVAVLSQYLHDKLGSELVRAAFTSAEDDWEASKQLHNATNNPVKAARTARVVVTPGEPGGNPMAEQADVKPRAPKVVPLPRRTVDGMPMPSE